VWLSEIYRIGKELGKKYGNFINLYFNYGYRRFGLCVLAFDVGLILIDTVRREIAIDRVYDHILEEYLFKNNVKEFDSNLRKFMGYIMHKHIKEFDQRGGRSIELGEIYSFVRFKVWNVLLGYGKKRRKIKNIDSDGKIYDVVNGNIRTFLYGLMKNEIVMYFYYKKCDNKRLILSDEHTFDNSVMNENTSKINRIMEFISGFIYRFEQRFGHKVEDVDNIMDYFLFNKKVEITNLYFLKLLSYNIFREFIGREI
jgi:hypothetical protein